jgi:hypothetical protein
VRFGRPGHDAVLAVDHELESRIVGALDDDRGRSECSRLDDHEPVPLPARGEEVAQCPSQRPLHLARRCEAGSRDSSIEAQHLDQTENLAPVGAIAEDLGSQLRDTLPRPRDRLDDCGRLLLGDVPAGEDDERLRRDRHRILIRHHRQPLDECDPAAVAELLEPARMEPREAQGLVPAPPGDALRQPAEAAGEPAEILQPVLPRPHLEPVDDDLEMSKGTRGQDGK